ncbi:C25 family peptidase propeptide domain-containing protein, partial [Chloroflexota bacterium]
MKSMRNLREFLILITLVLAISGAALLLTQAARAGQHESPPPSGIDQGLKVLESHEQSLNLEYTTPEYQVITKIVNGEQCQLLEVEGFGSSDQIGWPQVPIKGFLIGIPSGEPPTIEVLPEEAVIAPETYNLCPVGKPKIADTLNEELRYPGMEYVQDPDGYSIDRFSPENLVELGETGYIRSQRVAQLRLQPFQYNPVSGELRYYKNIRVRVNFNGVTDDVRTLDQNLVDEGPFEALLRDSLVNYGTAQSWREAPHSSLPLSQEAALETSQAYKILVDQDGIFQISYADLQTAGVPVDEINPRTFKIHNQGMETAIYVMGEDDAAFAEGEYLLFYGQKIKSKYTDTNVYWLTWGGADGKRMPIIGGAPAGSTNTPTHFQTNLHLEEDHAYQSSRPSGAQNDHWYWEALKTSTSTQETYTFTLESPSTLPVSIKIGGLFYSYSATPQHHTIVTVNGHLVDEAYWPSFTEYSFEADVSQEYLQPGENEITVEAPLDGGITSQIILINWFDIDYYDTYAAEDDVLWFDGELPGDQIFELSGFTDPDIDQDDVLFDITQPFTPTRIINADVQLIGSDYQLRFEQDIVNERHYLAFSPSRRLTPTGIIPDSPSDLRDTSNGADYII